MTSWEIEKKIALVIVERLKLKFAMNGIDFWLITDCGLDGRRGNK